MHRDSKRTDISFWLLSLGWFWNNWPMKNLRFLAMSRWLARESTWIRNTSLSSLSISSLLSKHGGLRGNLAGSLPHSLVTSANLNPTPDSRPWRSEVSSVPEIFKFRFNVMTFISSKMNSDDEVYPEDLIFSNFIVIHLSMKERFIRLDLTNWLTESFNQILK